MRWCPPFFWGSFLTSITLKRGLFKHEVTEPNPPGWWLCSDQLTCDGLGTLEKMCGIVRVLFQIPQAKQPKSTHTISILQDTLWTWKLAEIIYPKNVISSWLELWMGGNSPTPCAAFTSANFSFLDLDSFQQTDWRRSMHFLINHEIFF